MSFLLGVYSKPARMLLEEVAANTGFPIRYFSADFTPEPTAEEMRALREIDPRDLRNLEFR